MNKQEVIVRLCKLVAKVGDEVFQNKYAYDCFCGERPNPRQYQFEKDVLEFVERVVLDAITQKKVSSIYRASKIALDSMNEVSP